MHSGKFRVLIIAVMIMAVLSPSWVLSGPTQPNPDEEHPWGGEEPPVGPRPSAIVYTINWYYPVMVFSPSVIFGLNEASRASTKSNNVPGYSNLNTTSSTPAVRKGMSARKGF